MTAADDDLHLAPARTEALGQNAVGQRPQLGPVGQTLKIEPLQGTGEAGTPAFRRDFSQLEAAEAGVEAKNVKSISDMKRSGFSIIISLFCYVYLLERAGKPG